MSLKDRFLEFAWPGVLYLLFAISLLLFGILGEYLLSEEGVRKFTTFFYLPFITIVFARVLQLRWLGRKRKLRGAQWKQRIQQIADNIDPSFDDPMFDHFCEFTDESELERTIEFLKQMPKGHRNVNEAYDKVLESDG